MGGAGGGRGPARKAACPEHGSSLPSVLPRPAAEVWGQTCRQHRHHQRPGLAANFWGGVGGVGVSLASAQRGERR